MRRLIAMLIVATLAMTTGAAATDDKKITICHHTGSQSNPTVTITVSENAWDAHQKHGDTKGPCPAQPTATPTAKPTKSPSPAPSQTASPTQSPGPVPPTRPPFTVAPSPTAKAPVPATPAQVKQLPSTSTE